MYNRTLRNLFNKLEKRGVKRVHILHFTYVYIESCHTSCILHVIFLDNYYNHNINNKSRIMTEMKINVYKGKPESPSRQKIEIFF